MATALISSFTDLLDYQFRTRVVFGNGAVLELGNITRDLGKNNVLLVTDKGIVAAGHVGRAVGSMEAAGLQVGIYDAVRENPTTEDVARCVEFARSCGAEVMVGLGGGSSMDTAKGANFILTNGGEMKDYWGVGKAAKPMLPFIAVPTTAGTGSECQSAALIADEMTHQKMACLDPKAAARVAILDPELTLSQPAGVTACTGIDALAHALESAITKKRNAFSRMFSQEAFRLISLNFEKVISQPDNLDARGSMLLGSAFAGMAIESSMLGAAHSAANPLTAHHGVVHGQAVGVMLPGVVEFNAGEPEARTIYEGLARLIGLNGDTEDLVLFIERLLRHARLFTPLKELGVTRNDIPALAAEAEKQWTAQFNPRPILATDFAELYSKAYERKLL